MNWKKTLGLAVVAGLCASQANAQSVNTLIDAGLVEPHSIVVANGQYYITDRAQNQIKTFRTSEGNVESLAGDTTGAPGAADGTGVLASFRGPEGIVAARGGLVVADSGNHVLRLVTFEGVVTTLAGVAGGHGSDDNADPLMAKFRFPSGLAVDAAGNIYIADTLNNSIRKMDGVSSAITTLPASGLFQPNDVAVDEDSNLWVTDTRHHQVKFFSPTSASPIVTLGSGQSGADNAAIGSSATFNLPRGLKYLSKTGGLLISDTGNNLIRKAITNAAVVNISVESVAGVAGESGRNDAAAQSATFNAPIGMDLDIGAGTLLITDSVGPAAGGGAVRTIQTSDPLPQIETPTIGYLVRITNNLTGSISVRMREVTQSVFNNDVYIAARAEDGVETRFTFGETSPIPLDDSTPPDPSGNDPSPSLWDGSLNFPEPLITELLPDLTIKVRSFADNRISSEIANARFQFKTANPTLLGDNAASFVVNNVTSNAVMYYTTNLADPPLTLDAAMTNENVYGAQLGGGGIESGQTLSLEFGTNDTLTVKIRAYRENYETSGVLTKSFSRENFSANKITFGFAAGEGSSRFVAAPGQQFYAPITLDLLSGTSIHAMQFLLTSAPTNGAPPFDGIQTYQSLLKALEPGSSDPQIFWPLMPSVPGTEIEIDPFLNGLTNLSVVNTTFSRGMMGDTNHLLIGYLERVGKQQLYDAASQDLIAYSIAHNRLFLGAEGKVLVGAYGITIPEAAVAGEQYLIEISRPSAVFELETDVLLLALEAETQTALTNSDPISARKLVTVGQPGYIVGDVLPFGWFNAGDFGDGNILVNDIMQVFQAAIYQESVPPRGSDFRAAMDSSNGATNAAALTLSFSDVDAAIINDIKYGDGELMIDDVWVTFRRSLDPGLDWIRRFYSANDGLIATNDVDNEFRPATQTLSKVRKPATTNLQRANRPANTVSGEKPFVRFIAGDSVANPDSNEVQIPIRVKVKGDYPLRTLMLNLNVVPIDGGPMVTEPIRFDAGALGKPSLPDQRTPFNYGGVWLNDLADGIMGEAVIGTLLITIPEGANLNSGYAVRFTHASGSPNGYGIFPSQTHDGLLTMRDRSASSMGDNIPDSWRMRHFGTLHNLLSHEDADADGDGIPNWAEYRAGTHPNDPASALKLASRARASANGKLTLRWPSSDGKRYVVECSTSMNGGEWTPVSPVVDGDGDEMEFSETNSDGLRFYRVRLVED